MKNTSAAALLIFLLCITLSACSGGKFKITAHITGMPDGNVRIAYAAPDGVKDTWVMVKDGKFEAEGSSAQLTVVGIYDNGGKMLLKVAVQNGDKVSIEGDMAQKSDLNVRGTKANEEWFGFMHDNADAYSYGNEPILGMKIEQYIKSHPDNVVSTLLLLFDYPYRNATAKVEGLLNTISKDAKPEFLLQTHKALVQQQGTPITSIGTLNLLNTANKVASISALGSKFTILYFWNNDDYDHTQSVAQLKSMADKSSANLKIADIYLEADTMQWRDKLSNDNAPWQHFWAPGGPVDNELKSLAITTVPLLVVTDSSGKVAYYGQSTAQACQTAASAIKQ